MVLVLDMCVKWKRKKEHGGLEKRATEGLGSEMELPSGQGCQFTGEPGVDTCFPSSF